jgi:GDP-4-dehydro-6-deoxy-D-mannose reductase
MIAVVTGANGFCGRAMVAYLIALGVEVVSLRRADFYPAGSVATRPCAATIAAHLPSQSIDYVFHLVGQTDSSSTPELFVTNVLTATALFEALRATRQNPVVVLTGSAAEYGMITPADLPLYESRPENPVDSYGMSKTIQTRIGQLAIAAGHRVVLSRPFNIVGPGMPSRLALGNFLRQLATRTVTPPCILRTGTLQTSRDFVHIDDAVRAWWELANQPNAQGQIINLCSGLPLRIGQIVEWMVSAVPFPVQVQSTIDENRRNDSPEHFGSPALLRTLLGWAPTPLTADIVGIITRQHLASSCAA